jgi:hypothetical protein
MSIEKLMQPRYKVMVDYPSSCFFVGDILEMNGECAGTNKTESGCFARSIYRPERFSHIFKPLAWWEERTVDDMTQVRFVKVAKYVGYWVVGDVVPVTSFQISDQAKFEKYVLQYTHPQTPDTVIPATEEQYFEWRKKERKPQIT